MGGWKKFPPVAPPPTQRAIGVVVCNARDDRIAGAAVSLQVCAAGWLSGVTDADGYCELSPVPASLTASQVRVEASGYQPVNVHVDLAAGANQQVWVGGEPEQWSALRLPALQPVAPPRPQPVRRDPLLPFDRDAVDPESGAALPVRTALVYPPPPTTDIRYWRGNLCGLRVPGLPSIPGGAADPSLVFAAFLDRYREADQARILDRHLECGYTHLTLSWPDSRACGRSIAQYVATAMTVQEAGLFVDHHFFSKDFDGRDPDPASVFPVLDALIEAGAIDIGTFAWEANLFISPEHYEGFTHALAARAPGVPWYHHFAPHYCTWHRDTNDSPHAFWSRQPANVRGLKYQCVSEWSAGMKQARLNDALVRLVYGGLWAPPRTFDVVAWETTASLQFGGALDEAHGDLQGYETLCAPGPMPVMGFGNGARLPDGLPV